MAKKQTAKRRSPRPQQGGGGTDAEQSAALDKDSNAENFSQWESNAPLEEPYRWRGKLRYQRVPLNKNGNALPIEPGTEEIIEYDLDAEQQTVYPFGKWFLQAMVFDGKERTQAIDQISKALYEIIFHMAALSIVHPLTAEWQSMVQSGIMALSHATKETDKDTRQKAVKALRDVSTMFLKKFKTDAIQPWLAKLKSENARLWNESRRTSKRHKTNQLQFVMIRLSYFDSVLASMIREMDECEEKQEGDGDWLAKQIVKHVHGDDPGTQEALELALKLIIDVRIRPHNSHTHLDSMPRSLAWHIFARSRPEQYFEIVWPHLEQEWKRMTAQGRVILPKGTNSTSKTPRLSPGVFKNRCREITFTLLREYRFSSIPMTDEAIQQMVAKHGST